MFHSSPKSIRSYQKDVPFLMVGDPKKAFYKEFGVETSLGFISLKALGGRGAGMARGHFGLASYGGRSLGAARRLPDRVGLEIPFARHKWTIDNGFANSANLLKCNLGRKRDLRETHPLRQHPDDGARRHSQPQF